MLVARGQLPPLTEAVEWIVPNTDDRRPDCPDGYIVSFVSFHERGFSVPASRFLRGVLYENGLELQHLNPNGVLMMSAFATLCEGYLAAAPNFLLFRHFFSFALQKESVSMGDGHKEQHPAPIGCAGLRRKTARAPSYIPGELPTSNKGWHPRWFYLKNDPANPLPKFSGRALSQPLECWTYGCPSGEMKKIQGGVDAVAKLRDHGLSS